MEEWKKILQESIDAAREVGIPEDQILKTIEEIDSYFLDEED